MAAPELVMVTLKVKRMIAGMILNNADILIAIGIIAGKLACGLLRRDEMNRG